MSSKLLSFIAVASAVAVAGFAQESTENADHGSGSMSDRPQGLRFMNNRLTIKPYVALSYTYDPSCHG